MNMIRKLRAGGSSRVKIVFAVFFTGSVIIWTLRSGGPNDDYKPGDVPLAPELVEGNPGDQESDSMDRSSIRRAAAATTSPHAPGQSALTEDGSVEVGPSAPVPFGGVLTKSDDPSVIHYVDSEEERRFYADVVLAAEVASMPQRVKDQDLKEAYAMLAEAGVSISAEVDMAIVEAAYRHAEYRVASMNAIREAIKRGDPTDGAELPGAIHQSLLQHAYRVPESLKAQYPSVDFFGVRIGIDAAEFPEVTQAQRDWSEARRRLKAFVPTSGR